MTSLLLLVLPAALAHPVGGAQPSHMFKVSVEADQLRVFYSARVPTHDIIQELQPTADFGPEAGERFTMKQLDELRDNLALEIDGERVAWERVPGSEPTGRGDSRYLFYEQELAAPLSGQRHELFLSNGNRPDQLSFFQWTVGLQPPWVVEDSSLLTFEGGAVKRSLNGQVRMDEDMRELTLELRPAGPVEGLFRGEQGRALDDAIGEPLPWWLRGAGLGTVLGALGLLWWRGRRA